MVASLITGLNGFNEKAGFYLLRGGANEVPIVLSPSSLLIQETTSGNFYTFSGSFGPNPTFPPASGTITGLTVADSNQTVIASFSNLSIPVSTYLARAATQNWPGFVADALGSNGSLTGNTGNDFFAALPGSHAFDGGGGQNGIDYTGSGNAVSINLSVGQVAANGYGGSDTVRNIGAVVIGSSSTVQGGAGPATVVVKGSGNQITAGSGGLTVDYSQETGPVSIAASGLRGTDTLTGASAIIGSLYGTNFAGGYSWRQPVSGVFGVASNWTTNGSIAFTAPGRADAANFSGAVAATISGNGAVSQLNTTTAGSNWNFTGQVFLDSLNVTGAVTLSAGGRFTASGLAKIGPSANSTGSLIVSTGSSYVSTAAPETSNYILNVASAAGSSAGLYVTGPGALVDLGSDPASVGLDGAGVIAVSGGATARFATVDPNALASLSVGRGGQGFVGVAGNGALLQLAGAMYAGRSGSGTVAVGAGGYLLETAVGTGNASSFGSGGTVNGSFVTGGTGYLNVYAGGSATFGDGLNFGSDGATGFGSVQGTLTIGGPLRLGTGTTATGGTGFLQITNGATVRFTAGADTSSAYLGLGAAASTSGILFVDGPGSSVDVGANAIEIGSAGSGAVSVSNGALLKSSTADSRLRAALGAADRAGTAASLSITGRSAVVANGNTYFARAGVGSLVIDGGSSLAAGSAATGVTIGDGTPAVDASGNPNASVNYGGLAVAQISNGSSLYSFGDLRVGFGGTRGNLTITGSSSAVANGQVVVGGGADRTGGSGVATVQNGSQLAAGAQHAQGTSGITIAAAAGTTGEVDVIGSGSYANANGARITVGDAGAGVLNLVNGGAAVSGAAYADTEAALAVGGASGGSGIVNIVGAASRLAANGAAVLGGTNTGGGVTAGGTGTVNVYGGALQTGAMTIQSGSQLALFGPGVGSIGGDLNNAGLVTNAGVLSIQGTLSGSGSLGLSGGFTDVANLGSINVDFSGAGPATLRVHGLSGNTTVNNFHFGDVLDVAAGVSGVSLSGNTLSAGGRTITLNSAPSGYAYQLYGDAAGGKEVLLNPTSPPANGFGIYDVTTSTSATAAGTAFTGGVDYLQFQYINAGSDSLDVAANLPNAFIKTGSGTDVLQAMGGNNVLDAGGGSNFLIGGTGADGGRDFFIVDATGGGVADTFVNLHPGDAIQIFGFTLGTSTGVLTTGGAPGYTGATIVSDLSGGTQANATFTFAGLDAAAVGQHFNYSGGTANGSNYLLIQYT